MIRKIICPTDFSEIANNALQYAAKLAQAYSAELHLVHVAPSVLGIPVSEVGSLELALDTRCREISKLFKITTDFEIDLGPGSLVDNIASARQENTLVVMGTNGSDSMYQQFFGANTYQVISRTKCPVLVVPQKLNTGVLPT